MAEEDIFGMDMMVYKGMPGKRVGVQPYEGMCYIPLSAKRTSGTPSNWMAITGPQLQVKIKNQ